MKIFERIFDNLWEKQWEKQYKKLNKTLEKENEQREETNKDIRDMELRLKNDPILKEKVKNIAEEYKIKNYKTRVVRSELLEEEGKPIIEIFFEKDIEIMQNILINQPPVEIKWRAGGRWDDGTTEFLTFPTRENDIQIGWYGFISCGRGGLFSKTESDGWVNEMYGYKNIPSWSGADQGKYIKEKLIF